MIVMVIGIGIAVQKNIEHFLLLISRKHFTWINPFNPQRPCEMGFIIVSISQKRILRLEKFNNIFKFILAIITDYQLQRRGSRDY